MNSPSIFPRSSTSHTIINTPTTSTFSSRKTPKISTTCKNSNQNKNLSLLLLTTYITTETTRALYAYHALHTYPQISPSLIALLSELLKLSIALSIILKSPNTSSSSNPNFSQTTTTTTTTTTAPTQNREAPSITTFFKTGNLKQNITSLTPFALPAGLFLVNNLIYFIVLPVTSASVLQVCILAKIPTTGILHHFLIKPQKNIYAWVSLLFLCIGLVIFNIPPPSHSSSHHQTTTNSQNGGGIGSKEDNTSVAASWYLAPVAGLVIACLSAIASISGERLTKSGRFWESSAALYGWGVLFSVLSWPVTAILHPSPPSSPPNTTSTSTTSTINPITGQIQQQQQEELRQQEPSIIIPVLILVVLTAGVGIIVSFVLRKKDNILKLVGTSASLVAIAGAQFVLMPELRARDFTAVKACGGGAVAVSTWCYNHWSQRPWIVGRRGFGSGSGNEDGYRGWDLEEVDEFGDRGVRGYGGDSGGGGDEEKVSLGVSEEAERGEGEGEEEGPSVWDPDATKVLGCCIVIAFVTWEMARTS